VKTAVDQGKRVGVGFDGPETRPIYSGRSMAGRPNPGEPDNLWAGMSAGVQITAYLLSGLLVYGGIGFLLDWLAGTGKVFTAVGMVGGAALGIYLIYRKYGRDDDAKR
jgi:F0F1-type ATP synthase assembly protein I